MKTLSYSLIVTSTLCTLGAQLLLKRVIRTEDVHAAISQGIPQFVVAVASTPLAWVAVLIQALGYATWLVVLSKEKMAIAFALSGSFFYLLMGFSAWALYSEKLLAQQWIGIVLISTGVLLVAAKQ